MSAEIIAEATNVISAWFCFWSCRKLSLPKSRRRITVFKKFGVRAFPDQITANFETQIFFRVKGGMLDAYIEDNAPVTCATSQILWLKTWHRTNRWTQFSKLKLNPDLCNSRSCPQSSATISIGTSTRKNLICCTEPSRVAKWLEDVEATYSQHAKENPKGQPTQTRWETWKTHESNWCNSAAFSYDRERISPTPKAEHKTQKQKSVGVVYAGICHATYLW